MSHMESGCAYSRTEINRLASKSHGAKHFVVKGFEQYLSEGRTQDAEGYIRNNRRGLSCNVCGNSYRSEDALALHIRQGAHAPYAFKCPDCKDTFKRLSELLMHVESSACDEGISYGTESLGKMLQYLWKKIAD